MEEKIREEVGASAPLQYQVEDGGAGKASVGSFFKDIGAALVGGNSETLFNLHFDLQQPRPVHLQVSMNRQGVGSHAGLLVYSARLAKPVGGEVWLEEPKMFGKSKFTGDAQSAGKLNANGDLIKLANTLARVESQSGGLKLKIKRFCKIIPQPDGGSMLVLSTLPRPIKMGFGASVDALEFAQMASMIEAAL